MTKKKIGHVLFLRWLAGIFMLFLLSGIPFRAQSEDVKLVTGEYEPFTSAKLSAGGVVTDIVRQAFVYMGARASIEFLPWKRGYKLAEEGVYAATFPYLRTDERAEDFLYSQPIVVWESRVFAKVDTEINFRKMSDLISYTECLPHHYGGLTVLDGMFDMGEIARMRPPLAKNCWRMLLHGRADFFVEDIYVAEIARNRYLADQADQVKPLENVISNDQGFVIFPKSRQGSQALLDRFNAVLVEMSVSGELEAIRDRHIKELAAE